MRIAIGTDKKGENIATICEINNPKSKGEVAHFIAEVDLIKLELLNLWSKVKNWKE